MWKGWSVFALCFVISAPVQAGEPAVVQAQAERTGDGIYRFDVTVRHDDTGWDHYADKWEVLDSQGNLLDTRTLLHPHETEQPFTRGLSGVQIPADVSTVVIRAHDKVHGYGESTVTINLP